MGREPANALWGVGTKTAAKLAELGIATVADLAAADIAAVARRFGPTIGPWLVATARGLDSSHVSGEPYVPRSRGREVTFQQDIDDWERVRAEVLQLAGQITQDVVTEGRPAVRVVVKVRYRPFFTATHGVPLGAPSANQAEIEQAALAALDKFSDRRPVRLLGVRAEFAAEQRA
jgi:DNA polymerase-4